MGTKTWKQVIVKSRKIRPEINRWIVWRHLSYYTVEERNERLKTYFQFVFVREPLQRLLSAYKLFRNAQCSENAKVDEREVMFLCLH